MKKPPVSKKPAGKDRAPFRQPAQSGILAHTEAGKRQLRQSANLHKPGEHPSDRGYSANTPQQLPAQDGDAE